MLSNRENVADVVFIGAADLLTDTRQFSSYSCILSSENVNYNASK